MRQFQRIVLLRLELHEFSPLLLRSLRCSRASVRSGHPSSARPLLLVASVSVQNCEFKNIRGQCAGGGAKTLGAGREAVAAGLGRDGDAVDTRVLAVAVDSESGGECGGEAVRDSVAGPGRSGAGLPDGAVIAGTACVSPFGEEERAAGAEGVAAPVS